MNGEFRLFADCHRELLESPMWNKKQQMLYWRGMDGEIYRKKYNDDPNDYEVFELGIGLIGSMAFTEGDEMLLFGEAGKVWRWTPGGEPTLYRDFGGNLFNDCIVDPRGRIYCGMLANDYFTDHRGEHGSLWRWDPDGSFRCIFDDLSTTPNGIRFSPDFKKFYFALTDDWTIYEFDYDIETGALSNKRPFATDCLPDGITVDKAGRVWNAFCHRLAPLQVYDKTGKLEAEYSLPVGRLISVAIGGPENKSVFVTTGIKEELVGEHDGGVFVMETDAEGCDEFCLDSTKL